VNGQRRLTTVDAPVIRHRATKKYVDLLERLELNVDDVRLRRIGATRPEVLMAQLGSLRRPGVGRPSRLERR
jgi:hypothetical protein